MSFKKLTSDCLRKLRPSLQSQLPSSSQILNIVDLHLQGKVLTKTVQTDIYGIPGTEIINVIWTRFKSSPKHFITTLIHVPPADSSSSKLETKDVIHAFQNLVEWDKPIAFEAVPTNLVPHLEKVFREKGGLLQEKLPCLSLYLPEDDVIKLNTKMWEERARDKFEMDSLSEEHMEKINSYWEYGEEGAGDILKEIIKTYQCGKGIFKKGHRNSENLVSWGLLVPLGTIGSLYTLNEYRGYGLARWTFEECLKSMNYDLNLVPCCEVDCNNVRSRNLMNKIGMKFVEDVYYIQYMPPPINVNKQTWGPSFLKL